MNYSLWGILILNTFHLIIAYNGGPIFSHGTKAPSYLPNYAYKDLSSIYEARNIVYGFPSEYDRQLALSSGRYNPDSAIPIDVDVYYPKNGRYPKIFITTPRFGQGVPYSLGYLTDKLKPNGTEIQPYPSYEWHSSYGQDCNGLTSIFRIHIDSCGQMWILDSGEIELVQHCAPQIVVIDLATDHVIHRYKLPSKMYKEKISRFVTPMVDIADPAPRGNCKKAFVYMADPTGFGIVVYDVRKNKSWRIENKFTHPNPEFGTHTIAGESFELLDGSLGMSLTPPNLGLERMLYFHSFSNDVQVAIPLSVINNETNWLNDGISASLDRFIKLGHRGVQCGPSAMTAHGFLLCGFLEPIGLIAWNIRTFYNQRNFQLLAYNPNTLQFISGIKVITNPMGKDEVWMFSNRLQKVFSGSIDYNEINYRIQKCGVDDLLLNKSCKF